MIGTWITGSDKQEEKKVIGINSTGGTASGGAAGEQFHHLLLVLDSAPALIACKDLDDRFLFANQAFCRAMEMSWQELAERPFYDVFPPKQAESFRRCDLEVLESGQPKTGIVHLANLRGEQIWLRLDRSPVRDAAENIIGVVGSALDVTPLVKTREALLLGDREAEGISLEQEQLAAGLKSELANLCPTDNLIPICSVCKKIRDEADRWHPIENYINTRTGAKFTHGYCPECAEKVLREVQPLTTVCNKCGRNLDVTRYILEGRHFRRYSCPECGYSQEYVRERLKKE